MASAVPTEDRPHLASRTRNYPCDTPKAAVGSLTVASSCLLSAGDALSHLSAVLEGLRSIPIDVDTVRQELVVVVPLELPLPPRTLQLFQESGFVKLRGFNKASGPNP